MKMAGVEAIVACGFSCATVPVDGWAFSKLWLWFAVPLGVHPLGIFAAVGVMLTVRFITVSRKMDPETADFGESIKHTVTSAMFALVALGLGWLVHLCAR